MKGWKKCLLSGQLFAVLLTASFIGFSGKVNADYTPTIPETWNTPSDCPAWLNEGIFVGDANNSIADSKWWDSLSQIGESPTVNLPLYESLRTAPFAIMSVPDITATGTNRFVDISWSPIEWPANSLEAYRSQTGPNRFGIRLKYATSNADDYYYTIRIRTTIFNFSGGNTPKVNVPGLSATNVDVFSQGVSQPNRRVCGVKGTMTFDGNWPNVLKTQPQKLDVPIKNPVKGCSALDLPCWFSKVFDGFSDTLQGLAEALLKGITYLFVPDGDVMSYEFGQFMEQLTETLGFLAFPFEWIIGMLNALVAGITSDGSWGTSICGISSFDWSFPGVSGVGFFGSNVQVNWCSELSNKLATISRVILPVLLSYTLIRAFKHKIDEIHTK